jgi:hypothetical protein
VQDVVAFVITQDGGFHAVMTPEPFVNSRTDAAADQAAARQLIARLTLLQRAALAADTRLPGEIAGGYGVTAAVIVWAQRIVRTRVNWR